MTADDLADLNGLSALLAAQKAREGDRRDKRDIVNEILASHGAPDITVLCMRLARQIDWRTRWDARDPA